ncbi:hypothetical protein BUALT_Bualt14G0041300 [Buddleja alternifolia]|uniref:Uncharacterized protein n=1 Tax=Buddleja alternifolia TaxID=168488 RepID=A0AAV6WEQ6_9LAMI|nr:hypothetical protein BUALT_Bualt14G0041300 [Buddleja alternifolia]
MLDNEEISCTPASINTLYYGLRVIYECVTEVAELQSIWQLDIRGKIKTRMLEPRTVYAAYLVLKMGERVGGLELAKAVIRFVDDELDRDAAKRARTVHFRPAKDTRRDSNSVARADEWVEVKMGNFYISQGDDGEVEARLLEIRRWKTTSLIVEGILFRPTYSYTEIPLVSKRYRLTTVLA